MIYAWGLPVVFCLFCQCMILLFFLSSSGYDFSKTFGDNVSSWYYTQGYKDLVCFHGVIYHPFKVMGSAFKFEGNWLDISSLDRGLVYVSSIFLILLLVLVWIESLFFSMFINWYFWGFWNTECVHFNALFKFLCKYFILLAVVSAIFFNMFLAISTFFVIGFILCFSCNLFVNYNIDSGDYYEPLYFCVLNGNKFCIVTPSQFRVYNNIWFYNGIYWILEETELCRKVANRELHMFIVKKS